MALQRWLKNVRTWDSANKCMREFQWQLRADLNKSDTPISSQMKKWLIFPPSKLEARHVCTRRQSHKTAHHRASPLPVLVCFSLPPIKYVGVGWCTWVFSKRGVTKTRPTKTQASKYSDGQETTLILAKKQSATRSAEDQLTCKAVFTKQLQTT